MGQDQLFDEIVNFSNNYFKLPYHMDRMEIPNDIHLSPLRKTEANRPRRVFINSFDILITKLINLNHL